MPAAPILTGKSQGLNPLESAAGPLLALLTRLRNTIAHPAPARLRAQLLAYLRQFEERKGSQVAVLIVPTTAPESVEAYSLRVVEQWKVGRKKVDDGVLLLVAKDDRTMRIEVGYGLEGALPDATAKRIISEVIGRDPLMTLKVLVHASTQGANRRLTDAETVVEALVLAVLLPGCVGVYLDTFEESAAAFYESRGFVRNGRIENFPPGAARIFLSKAL